ncbi:MAG: hypothetical protein ACRERU_13795 [Methylococcales bacterium]
MSVVDVVAPEVQELTGREEGGMHGHVLRIGDDYPRALGLHLNEPCLEGALRFRAHSEVLDEREWRDQVESPCCQPRTELHGVSPIF